MQPESSRIPLQHPKDKNQRKNLFYEEMEEYEIAFNSAMDDTDPQLVKKAMEIATSSKTYEEKTDAIWKLFQERRSAKLNAVPSPK
jgi:hypothetical protein